MSTELAAGSIYQIPTPLKAGETLPFAFSWRSSADGVTPKTYADLDLYNWRCSFKRRDQLSGNPAVTLTSPSSGLVISGTGNRTLTLTLLPAQSILLTPTKWYRGDFRATLKSSPTTVVVFPLRAIEFMVEAPITAAT
jgi:hypothetical protein